VPSATEAHRTHGQALGLQLDCRALNRYLSFVLIGLVISTSVSSARDKAVFETTKLIELQRDGKGFCYVIQINDLAYVAVSGDSPTSNLIVGDPVEVKVNGDSIRLKSNKKWPAVEPDGTIKTKIMVRQRITEGNKLPSCAMPITVH
jgi:hypothetical protein